MRVNNLHITHYRNLSDIVIETDKGVNIFYGDNAQGKTNLIEAIWLFTGGRSFRGAKDKELIPHGAESAKIAMNFFAEDRDQEVKIDIVARRKATLNGVSLPSATALAGHFCAVVFSPAHLNLTEAGPAERRKFIDTAYCQLRPAYIQVLSQYHKTLEQRNALLKNRHHTDEDVLTVFDDRLAEAGLRVMAARTAFIKKLTPLAEEKHSGMSGGSETLTLQYQPTANATDKQGFIDCLRAARGADIAAGFTTVGPHRDELELAINGQSVRRFGSQGQKRSTVLSLKLAEADLIEQVVGEPPVILLDDVMSELDPARQHYLLHHIEDRQVFITCCDPDSVSRFGQKYFAVKDGKVSTT